MATGELLWGGNGEVLNQFIEILPFYLNNGDIYAPVG